MNSRFPSPLLPLTIAASAILSGCAAPGRPILCIGFAPVPGGKLYYAVAERGPAVVLIHGGQLDRRLP